MPDLSTKYLGLDLRTPIIAGSSGLTQKLDNLKEFEESGAGAVVLKSLFEEEIILEMKKAEKEMKSPGPLFPEIYDMFDLADVEDGVTNYLALIEDAKKELSIPVIASVNCVQADEWTVFAKRIEEAGADALEVNIFISPSDESRTGAEIEKVYKEVAANLKKEIKLPIAFKISRYFTNPGAIIRQIDESGVEGIVMFNKFYSPDIETNHLEVIPAKIYSAPEDILEPLRRIGVMSGRVKCDLCASSGVYTGNDAFKLLLVGAKAVQTVSAMYKRGPSYMKTMIDELSAKMEAHKFKKIEDFRGKLSQTETANPAMFERMQFMKHFSEKHIKM